MILASHGIIASSGMITSTLNESLYAVYKAESNANDSFSTYNGTAQGGLTYTTGKSGNAFNFNGTNAYVNLGNDIFNSFTGDFSVSCWVNLNSITGNQMIFHNQSFNSSNAKSNGWSLIARNNSIKFEIYNNSGSFVQLSDSGFISSSTWYNVVLTRKASTRSRIYINGTLQNSNASTLNPTYDTTLIPIPSSIGAYRYNATTVQDYFNGKIDELNLWTKELTSTEVTDLYNSGSGKFYPF
jgi:hypothetical protein